MTLIKTVSSTLKRASAILRATSRSFSDNTRMNLLIRRSCPAAIEATSKFDRTRQQPTFRIHSRQVSVTSARLNSVLQQCLANVAATKPKQRRKPPIVSPIVLQWLSENFEPEFGVALPCRAVYDQFMLLCTKHNLRTLDDSHFGRLLHSNYRSHRLHRCKLGMEAVITERSSNLRVITENQVTLAKVYECARQHFLSNLGEMQGRVHVSMNETEFALDYDVRQGTLLFNLKNFCEALAIKKPYENGYSNIFQKLCTVLISEDKDKSFAGPSCVPRCPKIDDFLTDFGAKLLLSYYSRSESVSAIVRAICSALYNSGLLNPFYKLPPFIRAQPNSIRPILTILRERFPDLTFKENFVIENSASSGFRILDVYCPEVKLNIECNEQDHRLNIQFYSEDYELERKNNIRTALGEDVDFHPYNPHDKSYTSAGEADSISSRILFRLNEKGIEVPNQTNGASAGQPSLTSNSAPADPTTPLDLKKASTSLTFQALQKFYAEIRNEITHLEVRRLAFLSSLDEKQLYALEVSIMGKCHAIKYCTDATVPGILIVSRVSLSKAICGGLCKYDHFLNCEAKLNCKDYFAPAIDSLHRVGGRTDPGTEALATIGVEAMLNSCEETRPEAIAVIRREMINHGLIPAIPVPDHSSIFC